MTVFLVGENIDKDRAHYQAETGRLVQVMRGIYFDINENIETAVLKHAVRIAKYLYPKTYLAAASAVLLTPTATGNLYLAGRRNQRTRIRNLEIIQNQAPRNPSLSSAFIDDGMGEFKVEVSSLRQRFLEAFRLRSEHAHSIDQSMREDMARRLIEEYGSVDKAADSVFQLARENGWYREGESVDRYFRMGLELAPVTNLAVLNFVVAWHGKILGYLKHDGFEWRWTHVPEKDVPLIRQTVPGKLPSFITSLLPEGWLEKVLKSEDERAVLRSGKRYMSNIVIVEDPRVLADLPEDIRQGRLRDYSSGGLFTGTYKGARRDTFNQSFEENLARVFRDPETPRLSGVQVKAPMCLEQDGSLVPATARPFTHILKPAGTSGFRYLPLVEWMSLSLGRSAGFEVPDFSLVAMPDEMPPALIVERFDIRTSEHDNRRMAMEDFCSLLDLPPEDKYKGTIEQAGRALRGISTRPNDDLLLLLKRAVFAWLIADGDMHLKNMAVLKTAMPDDIVFRSVRMAPLYDAVTTVVFPNLEHDRMALKLNGKDSRLKLADFTKAAVTMGIGAAAVESEVAQMLKQLRTSLDLQLLPAPISNDEMNAMIVRMKDISMQRINKLGQEMVG